MTEAESMRIREYLLNTLEELEAAHTLVCDGELRAARIRLDYAQASLSETCKLLPLTYGPAFTNA